METARALQLRLCTWTLCSTDPLAVAVQINAMAKARDEDANQHESATKVRTTTGPAMHAVWKKVPHEPPGDKSARAWRGDPCTQLTTSVCATPATVILVTVTIHLEPLDDCQAPTKAPQLPLLHVGTTQGVVPKKGLLPVVLRPRCPQ